MTKEKTIQITKAFIEKHGIGPSGNETVSQWEAYFLCLFNLLREEGIIDPECTLKEAMTTILEFPKNPSAYKQWTALWGSDGGVETPVVSKEEKYMNF